MTPWWERWAGRLEYELNKLQSAGYRVVEQNDTSGYLVLEVLAPNEKTGCGEVKLTVTFPDEYPRSAPQVSAPGLDLAHHQHPFGKILCLIGRSTEYWDSHWCLAALLDSQLRKTIAAGNSPTGAGIDEADQGEPFSDYYSSYSNGMTIFISVGDELDTEATCGVAEFSLQGPLPPAPGELFMGLLHTLWTDTAVVHQVPVQLNELFGRSATVVSGRWTFLPEPVKVDDPAEIWSAAAEADSHPTTPTTYRGIKIEVRAIAFPEERSRTTAGVGWAFVVKKENKPTKRKRPKSGNPAKRADAQRTSTDYYLVRAARAAEHDLAARTPQTAATSSKSVAVVGCGAIGSIFIEHLARTGVGNFHLIDKDLIEPGNLTRHAATMQHAGLHKSVAMAKLVRTINPYASANALVFTVGQPAPIDESTPSQLLSKVFAEVDLVVDATAEVGVQEITADLASEAGKPWMMLSASPGAWGGTVVVAEPDAEWCFACFQRHRADRAIPFPPESADKPVQPPGCAEPTFTGPGFDLAEVSLHAARTAVGRLLRDQANAYPVDIHPVHVLTIRQEDEQCISPRWVGYDVTRHPQCPGH